MWCLSLFLLYLVAYINTLELAWVTTSRGKEKRGNLHKQHINSLRPIQTWKLYISEKTEDLRNQKREKDAVFGLLYSNVSVFI